MPTSLNNSVVARDAGENQIHYLRKTITYLNSGTAVTVGVLPAGAVITGGGVRVVTAFDGSGTDLIDVGVTADDDDLATDLPGQTVGFHALDELAGANDSYSATSPLTVTATYTDQNSNATAGEAIVIIAYATNT